MFISHPDYVIFDSDFPGKLFVSQHVNMDGWATLYTFPAKEQGVWKKSDTICPHK